MDTPQGREEKASALLDKGYQAQRQGDLGDAMRFYQESIRLYPTAEAHTSLGWTYSFLHRYEDAIEECRTAIAINPEFGNPYNDIGLYLMKMGKLDDAIPWLEHALEAAHYDTPHYPHLNLGRIALAKGEILQAAREFGRALEVEPRSLTARRTLAALSAQLN